MEIITTSIYERNARAWLNRKNGIRRALNEGGTSSSKTYSILQLLILIAQHAKRKFLISVVSESLPHLKRGCIRDFQAILGDNFQEARWNRTDKIYEFGNGKLEFFSADEPSKLRGGRRDILFINEANNISYDAYRELDVRTRLFVFMDWNPTGEFWAHEKLINKPENVYIHSTYQDCKEVIPPELVHAIELNKDRDLNWWNVYGLGRLGRVEGLVYPLFEQVDSFDGEEVFYGLDFGFSNDPTALARCMLRGNELYTQELIFETGLTNQDIANRMLELGIKKHFDEIFADSAEPKSIEEIYRYGFNIKGAGKGQGSVEYGHQLIRQYKSFWTKDSLNGIKEQRNFRYVQDKNGKLTEKTTHNFSHLMDARRYGVCGKLEPKMVDSILVFDAMREFNLDKI